MLVPGAANAGLLQYNKVLTLHEAITYAGLAGNASLILDAGDAASYTSGQKWLDRSGGGYDFFRGTSDSATTDDPTFNGTAGGVSSGEYWTFDGDDHFNYDTTNEAWMQLQADNAAFTLIVIHWPVALAARQGLMGTRRESVGDNGWWFVFDANDKLEFLQDGDSTHIVYQTDAAIATGSWHVSAVSWDEAVGAGGAFFWNNGAYLQKDGSDTFDSTYTAGAATATQLMQIGALGGSERPLQNNYRVAAAAVLNTAVSKEQLDRLYNLIRWRFGI